MFIDKLSMVQTICGVEREPDDQGAVSLTCKTGTPIPANRPPSLSLPRQAERFRGHYSAGG